MLNIFSAMSNLTLNPNIRYLKREEFYYLEDTKRSQLYRIGEPEHEVFSLLLQNLPVEEIGERLTEKSKIQNEEIQKFKARLVELGILVRPSNGKETSRIKSSKINIFHLRFPLFNPSRVLEWFVRLKISSSIFSLPSLLIVLSIIGAGMVILLRNKDVLLSFNLLFHTPQYIPIFFFVFLLSTLLHELAHGLVCTYYRGKVKELGIGLFYFIPSFYVSLKGIWLFKKKTHRIFTYLSGLLMDLFICSLFLILCQLFSQSNIILLFSKILILSVIIRTIFIINPFIESDFYRILTHFFNIPNLRQKAFTTIYGLIRRKTKITGSITKREKRFSILYGISFLTFWSAVLSFSLFFSKGFFLNNI